MRIDTFTCDIEERHKLSCEAQPGDKISCRPTEYFCAKSVPKDGFKVKVLNTMV